MIECHLCHRQISSDEIVKHLGSHMKGWFINVWSGRAELCYSNEQGEIVDIAQTMAWNPDDPGRQAILDEALHELDGARNLSGRYYLTPEVQEWLVGS